MLDTTQALDVFLMGIERRAFRMAMIATTNKEDALDIVQDAMLKLVQRYSNKPEAEWGPLFHRILQSKIRDWYRRSKVRNRWRHFLKSDSSNIHPTIDDFPDANARKPETQLANKMAIGALENAMQQLPFRQQQVFLLRAWEELSVNETANLMGCSEGSVKTHYSRAVHTLRTVLEDHKLEH